MFTSVDVNIDERLQKSNLAAILCTVVLRFFSAVFWQCSTTHEHICKTLNKKSPGITLSFLNYLQYTISMPIHYFITFRISEIRNLKKNGIQCRAVLWDTKRKRWGVAICSSLIMCISSLFCYIMAVIRRVIWHGQWVAPDCLPNS